MATLTSFSCACCGTKLKLAPTFGLPRFNVGGMAFWQLLVEAWSKAFAGWGQTHLGDGKDRKHSLNRPGSPQEMPNGALCAAHRHLALIIHSVLARHQGADSHRFGSIPDQCPRGMS